MENQSIYDALNLNNWGFNSFALQNESLVSSSNFPGERDKPFGESKSLGTIVGIYSNLEEYSCFFKKIVPAVSGPPGERYIQIKVIENLDKYSDLDTKSTAEELTYVLAELFARKYSNEKGWEFSNNTREFYQENSNGNLSKHRIQEREIFRNLFYNDINSLAIN